MPESESRPAEDLPLSGLLVIDLSQFLAGPYASLRLQDLGARVIKIERPDGGDLTRRLYLSDTLINGESTLFHAINRGKESLALDLKCPEDKQKLLSLVSQADVFLQNFRPGVIERLGLDYASIKSVNDSIVYASISGYGTHGPWVKYPGQDLLAQARSGVMWLNGSDADGPVPFGLAVADMFAGANTAQGILAALVKRGIRGRGSHIETSLIEAMSDFQFEVLATYLNDGGRAPRRARYRSAHVGLAAPYGVYETADGFLAIAMTPLGRLADLLEIEALIPYAERPDSWFVERDGIKNILSERLRHQSTAHWLEILEREDIWCARVADWSDFLGSEGFKALDMVQKLHDHAGGELSLMRCPIRVDGIRPRSRHAAPQIGQHSADIIAEFGL
ncbi:Acetyl-CoA:oxalate CoA-transferase [Granulosicoccus antarcticus IMCC3135]|uniref:Acetyl-CoA:oxalate CoA-transferase n=2 Tax=Granulosicoccus TaxID=437504 RepID=A0A2Z2P6E0_9GAMM|nr:Acetyl-CoA:oxalate CoA-transferase [Granulosicoccus antarcticus IMCC3135]